MPGLGTVSDYFRRRLWQEGPTGPTAFFYWALRVLILAGHGLWQNRSLVRAASLAYASILALIPMLALLFAVWAQWWLMLAMLVVAMGIR